MNYDELLRGYYALLTIMFVKDLSKPGKCLLSNASKIEKHFLYSRAVQCLFKKIGEN